MRKIIRVVTEAKAMPKNNNSHGMSKADWKAYHADQRIEKKLLYLKRATLLSYISICCTKELTASLALETKDSLIDYLICNGHGEDCTKSYQVN
jgi:hypothetical protein